MIRLVPLALLAGCSLGPNPARCGSDQECRDAFGLGSTCTQDGFCAEPDPPERCQSTVPDDVFLRPDKYADHRVIGIIADITTDEPQVRSAELAVSQVTDLGGLDGQDFVAIGCTYEVDSALDDLDAAAATESIMTYLTDVLGAQAIVGASTSDRSIDAYAVAEQAGALLISASATSPELTTIDGDGHTDAEPGLFWRTVPPDDLQGRIIAADLESRGVASVAAIVEESSYATALADVFEASYSGTVQRFEFDNPTTRSEAIADAGNAGEPEVVFLSAEADDIVAFFGAAAVSSDFNGADPIEIFLADAAADPFVLANTADVADVIYDRVRGTRPKVPSGDVFDQFQAAYASVYGSDPADAVFAPYSYDAAWLLLYGHAWALFNEPEVSGIGIARGLRRVSQVGGEQYPVRPGSWDPVVQSFEAGNAVDLEGASGSLDFDPVSGETVSPVEVWVIDPAGTGFDTVVECEPDGTCRPV